MSPVEDVFDFWRQCAGHARARLDDKRAREIARALRWRYTVDDLKLAILGCCTDPWYRGQNDRQAVYTSLGLILRDADHIDKFMKAGEAEYMRCWMRALEEELSRQPKSSMPPDARRRMMDLVKPRRAS